MIYKGVVTICTVCHVAFECGAGEDWAELSKVASAYKPFVNPGRHMCHTGSKAKAARYVAAVKRRHFIGMAWMKADSEARAWADGWGGAVCQCVSVIRAAQTPKNKAQVISLLDGGGWNGC